MGEILFLLIICVTVGAACIAGGAIGLAILIAFMGDIKDIALKKRDKDDLIKVCLTVLAFCVTGIVGYIILHLTGQLKYITPM